MGDNSSNSNVTASGGGTANGTSVTSFTAEDLLNLSNAGNAGKIIQLVSQVSGSSGTATVKLTATYGGTGYEKDIGFDVTYSCAYTSLAALKTFLNGITGTDAAHPAKVNITGLTAGNWTDIRTALVNCPSVFVDLSATVLLDGIANISLDNGFIDCSNLVVPPTISGNVINMRRCFSGCTSLSGTVTINASITNPIKWSQAFEDVDPDKIDKIKVPDAPTQTALRNSSGMPDALKAKVLCPDDPDY